MTVNSVTLDLKRREARCLAGVGQLSAEEVSMVGRSGAVSAAVGAAVLLAGCGTTADQALEDLQADQRARVSAVARAAPYYETLEELLPNVRFETTSAPPAPLAACVVAGTITDVEEGVGGKTTAADTWVTTTFDDADAESRTLHATLRVDTLIGSDSCPGTEATETVQFGLAIGPETSVAAIAAESALLGLGTVVAFLWKSPVFDYDESLYGVVEDGVFLVDVREDGTLSLPFADAEIVPGLLANVDTLDELVDSGNEPAATISVSIVDGVPVRD